MLCAGEGRPGGAGSGPPPVPSPARACPADGRELPHWRELAMKAVNGNTGGLGSVPHQSRRVGDRHHRRCTGLPMHSPQVLGGAASPRFAPTRAVSGGELARRLTAAGYLHGAGGGPGQFALRAWYSGRLFPGAGPVRCEFLTRRGGLAGLLRRRHRGGRRASGGAAARPAGAALWTVQRRDRRSSWRRPGGTDEEISRGPAAAAVRCRPAASDRPQQQRPVSGGGYARRW